MGNYQAKLPTVNTARLSLKHKGKQIDQIEQLSTDQRSEETETAEKELEDTGMQSEDQVREQQDKEDQSSKEECPELTEEQKKIIVDTWKVLEEDIARVGVIVFINLFETHPDVQNVFMPFNGIILEDLKQSKQLRAHALRVMGFVQKAVARLNEPQKLGKLLQELGKNHVVYGAKAEYMDFVGPQFIAAIRPSLATQWNNDIYEAWTQLFRVISYIMKGSMDEPSDLETATPVTEKELS